MSFENYKRPCGCEGKIVSENPFIYDETPCEGHSLATMKAIELKIVKEENESLKKQLEMAREALDSIKGYCAIRHDQERQIVDHHAQIRADTFAEVLTILAKSPTTEIREAEREVVEAARRFDTLRHDFNAFPEMEDNIARKMIVVERELHEALERLGKMAE